MLGIAFIAMSDVGYAQVFAPRSGQKSTTQASAPKNPVVTQPAKTENAPVVKAASVEENANEIKKNFSSEESEEKYDNSSPKIVSFKIVNGEVILDEDKERSILIYYDNVSNIPNGEDL